MNTLNTVLPKVAINFDLVGVKSTFKITASQKVEFTFYKVEYNILHYSMNVAGVEVQLKAEPTKVPNSGSHIGLIGASTYYKLMFVEEEVRLGKILRSVECNLEKNIAPYGFCSCGNYKTPMFDYMVDSPTYCNCLPYAD